MKEFIVSIHNDDTVQEFLKEFEKQLKEGDALKISLKSYSEGSLPQKALLHIWIREYASKYLKKHIKAITEDDQIDIKTQLKQKAYKQYGWDFLVRKVTNHELNISALVLKSVADYSKGELYMFMEFVQDYVASQGLILNSQGEYQDLKNETMQ